METKNDALGDITRMVMSLLDGWGLRSAEVREVLALPAKVGGARHLHRYREGHAAFPEDPAVLRRAQYVIRIGDALRTTYPRNPSMGGRWMRQGHRRFGRRSPLSIISQDGEGGMIAVLSELDCTFSWDMTGSTLDRRDEQGRSQS